MKLTKRALAEKVSNQKGMTLLEIIIALGIVGVVSAGVVTLAQRAIDSQNMTAAVQSLNTIQIAATQTYRGNGTYPAFEAADPSRATQNLVGLGRVSESEAKNPFTGDMIPFITFGKADTTDNKAFGLAMEGLTQDQCKQLITNAGEMFPFIQVQNTANATQPTGTYQTTQANAAATVGIIKSVAIGSVNLDMSNLDHTEALCGGPDEAAEGAMYSVIFGNS